MNRSRFPTVRLMVALLVIGKLWLVAAQPVVAIGGASHDDRLFLVLAEHLVQGDWLGPYDELTLAKGPMYPLWIAGAFLAGVPLPLANHLLYLTACLLVLRALRPHLGGQTAWLALFALLWLNPMTYEAPVLGRILRQNLATPFSLFVFAGLIALETRRQAPTGVRLAWGALAGGSFAALWLTREEGVWVVPSVVWLVAAAGRCAWRGQRSLRPLVAPLATALGVAGLAWVTVGTLNHRSYGWFGTVEFRAPQFIAAYGALQRITSRTTVPFVPVTREARERAYAVSPAFAELRPHLEGELGASWARISSSRTGRPEGEREIAGGWFMWAFRGAVAAAGHHRDAAGALDFYQRIADEVNGAIAQGKLPGGPRRDTLMPKLSAADLRRLGESLPEAGLYFATFRGFSARGQASEGNASLLMLFRDLTRWHLTPAREAPELALPRQQELDAWRVTLLHQGGKALRPLAAIVVLGGLLGWLILAVLAGIRRSVPYRLLVSTALLGAVAAVVLLNTLVHVTSFPNLGPGAFAQAYPLALLFGGLVAHEAYSRWRPLGRPASVAGPTPAPARSS